MPVSRLPDFEPFFIWSNRPRIMYGPGSRSEIPYEMTQLGGRRVLVYTDSGIVKAGVAELVLAAIRDSELELAGVFADIVQDARIDIINQGAAFYRENKADAMVVIGGGSVMDTAKAINIMIGAGVDNFGPLARQGALWDEACPLPPQIVLPTTAGTGSEVTHAMVILDVEDKVKLAASHPYNADLAILDPELTVSLPARITAFTGLDALTHAIEGIASTAAEPIADALGLHAIRLIFQSLPVCVRESKNLAARGDMLIASTMAGMCFGNVMTGAVHALAHALGARHGIPHGLANAMLLPEVMEYNLEVVPERYALIAAAMGEAVAGLTPAEAGKKAVAAVRRLEDEVGLRVGMAETLAAFGVSGEHEDLRVLAELAMGDSQLPYNPRELEEEEMIKLYCRICGKDK